MNNSLANISNVNDWFVFIAIFLGIFLVLGIAEFVAKHFKFNPDSTRKLIHVIVGSVVSICPFVMTSNEPLLLLCLIFIAINSYLLFSNSIDSMNKISRVTYGTIFFPISIFFLAALFWEKPISYTIAVWILTFADPFAASIGKRSKYHYKIWKDEKSLAGSFAMFSMSFMIVMIATDLMSRVFNAAFFLPIEVLFGLAFFTALSSTLSEMISNKGSDNISIPICSFLSYEIFLINYTHGKLIPLFIWFFISIIIFSIAYKLRSVSISGAISGYLIGIFVFGSGGISWIMPLVLFFISSSILSKLKKKKNPKRNVMQIMANGLVATVIALIYFFNNDKMTIVLFYSCLAATTADTWGTEIGHLSNAKPRLIFSNIKVDKGTSGGVTLLGTLGSLGGSALIAGAFYFIDKSLTSTAIIFLSGFSGSLLDSALGRFYQARFKCIVCGKVVEEKVHCNQEAIFYKKIKWIDNNMVNFFNACFGALLSQILLLFL